jgi:hypothetical protein
VSTRFVIGFYAVCAVGVEMLEKVKIEEREDIKKNFVTQ